ncbi:hypothetical protein [Bacillus sp. 196mf]|nr:hypothetical protein [Bacillus sp. 196mf]PYE88568.1 hypothetical protein ATL10_104415 [Bacillus sp. 196mf]
MKRMWGSLIGVMVISVLTLGLVNAVEVKQSTEYNHKMSEGDHH